MGRGQAALAVQRCDVITKHRFFGAARGNGGRFIWATALQRTEDFHQLRLLGLSIGVIGDPGGRLQVEELMSEMRGRGIKATAVTYGCALAACEARRDAAGAFRLYHEACAAGVPLTDIVHDALIKACVAAGQLDEALDAIKRLMRAHGDMQAHTFNSVTRALCDQYVGATRRPACTCTCRRGAIPSSHRLESGTMCRFVDVEVGVSAAHTVSKRYESGIEASVNVCCGPRVDRAMYMHRFMRLRKLTAEHRTFHALVAACAREGKAAPALALYVEMRAAGHLPTGKAGSPLIAALARCGHAEAALLVLHDMVACSNGSTAPSSALPAAAAALSGDGSGPAASPRGRWGTWGGGAGGAGSDSLRALVEALPALEFSHWERLGGVGGGKPAKRARGRRRGSQRHGARPLRKGDMLPQVSAVAALVLALCTDGECELAVRMYAELQRAGPPTLAGLLARHTRMFERLMEITCRSGQVEFALGVFDDWKAARDHVMRQDTHRAPPDEASSDDASPGEPSGDSGTDGEAAPSDAEDRAAAAEVPRLSNVTLAFLEASCHAHDSRGDLEWRVYDVCALMRQQQEVARDALLARPAKGSHHFLEDTEDDGGSDGADPSLTAQAAV